MKASSFLNQLSRILFVFESLHYLTLDLLSCVLFFLESFFHLGTHVFFETLEILFGFLLLRPGGCPHCP